MDASLARAGSSKVSCLLPLAMRFSTGSDLILLELTAPELTNIDFRFKLSFNANLFVSYAPTHASFVVMRRFGTSLHSGSRHRDEIKCGGNRRSNVINALTAEIVTKTVEQSGLVAC